MLFFLLYLVGIPVSIYLFVRLVDLNGVSCDIYDSRDGSWCYFSLTIGGVLWPLGVTLFTILHGGSFVCSKLVGLATKHKEQSKEAKQPSVEELEVLLETARNKE